MPFRRWHYTWKAEGVWQQQSSGWWHGDNHRIKAGSRNGAAAQWGSEGARSWLNKMEKLAVKPNFLFFPPSPLAVFMCHNKMSCAEIYGVQKYFLWLLPFPALSSAPFTVCQAVTRSLTAWTVNGTQLVSQVGKVVRALDRAKKEQNVVSTDLFMPDDLMLGWSGATSLPVQVTSPKLHLSFCPLKRWIIDCAEKLCPRQKDVPISINIPVTYMPTCFFFFSKFWIA